MRKLQSLCTKIKRRLAQIPSPSVVQNIMSYATVAENGDLMLQGKKIGHYNRSTMIGWCSLIGYIRIAKMAAQK